MLPALTDKLTDPHAVYDALVARARHAGERGHAGYTLDKGFELHCLLRDGVIVWHLASVLLAHDPQISDQDALRFLRAVLEPEHIYSEMLDLVGL